MNHSFNIEVAKNLSIQKAIILENIVFWWKKDVANNNNYHDWKYRVYNSSSAFEKLMPYMSCDVIKRNLKELVLDGYLETGIYNKMKFDKTLWYTITEKTASIYGNDVLCIFNDSMVWNYTMDGVEWHHPQCEITPTIPIIIPFVNPVTRGGQKKQVIKKQTTQEEIDPEKIICDKENIGKHFTSEEIDRLRIRLTVARKMVETWYRWIENSKQWVFDFFDKMKEKMIIYFWQEDWNKCLQKVDTCITWNEKNWKEIGCWMSQLNTFFPEKERKK